MGADIETFLYGAVCVNMERIYNIWKKIQTL